MHFYSRPGLNLRGMYKIVVWDTQTGILITETEAMGHRAVLFCKPQRIITLYEKKNRGFSIQEILSGTLLFDSNALLFQDHEFCAYWVHEDTLQFATSFKTDENFMINIYELQPTSTPPFHMLSSFPRPPCSGIFSFSPVSFHAGFVTATKVVVLDIQNSKFMLDVKVAPKDFPLSGQFSPNGDFFACQRSKHEICVWQNTPTGYVFWSVLRSRFPVQGFSWSPTSFSILCYGVGGIHLLHPSPMSPNEGEPSNLQKHHLVAYSPDWTYIAIAQQGDSVITVLDSLLGTILWLINTNMKIEEIKIAGMAIFVVDTKKLASWDLEAGGITPGVHQTFATVVCGEHLILSHDCSLVIFSSWEEIFLYDLKAQKILKASQCSKEEDNGEGDSEGSREGDNGEEDNGEGDSGENSGEEDSGEEDSGEGDSGEGDSEEGSEGGCSEKYSEGYIEKIYSKQWHSQEVDIQTIHDIRISPDGHQVWFSYDDGYHNHLAKLEVKEDWHWSPMEIVGVDPDKSWSWINLFSPGGYQVGKVSEWAVDFRGRKILWFPPHWRVYDWKKVRWDGDFLAFVGDNHPTPIIIKFQPQHTPPHSY